MDKVIDVEVLRAFKEAAKKLESQNIGFDKKRLVDSPELCGEIIRLIDYFGNEQITMNNE